MESGQPDDSVVDLRELKQARHAGSVFSTGIRAVDPVDAILVLVELGELHLGQVMSGAVTVADRSRRCRCLIVRSGDNGWVVKQGTNAETFPAVVREAEVYRSLQDASDGTLVTPRFVHASPGTGLLVISYVDGVPLRDAGAGGDLSERQQLGLALGETIASIHAHVTEDPLPMVGHPSILRCATPTLDVLEYHSSASLELIRLIQKQPGLCDVLHGISKSWTPAARTHNDLRSDNVLVRSTDGQLVVIDWEMAGLGDPRWDLAGPLVEQLVWWLEDSEVWTARSRDGRSGAASGLRPVHSFAYSLLDSYASRISSGRRPELARFLNVTSLMRWCAARLVHASFAGSYRSPTVTPTSRQMLQIALNIHRSPAEAARLFYGLQEA